jgi:hypothetical protein
MAKTKYESDIVIGERYKDEQTGIEGVATGLTFFQYACERVSIEFVVNGELNEFTFDAPRLTRVSTSEKATAKKPGGPDRGTSHIQRGPLTRR